MPIPAAGSSPAGYAAVADPSAAMGQDPQGPVVYDPKARDFAGTGGRYAETNTVDQQVALALTVPAGAIKSCPDVGHTLREIKRLDPQTIQADVEDRVRQALSRVIQQIEIQEIATDVTTARGQLRVAVRYLNLTTGRVQTTQTSVQVS